MRATWVGKADKMQEGPLGATPHDNNKVRPSLATPSLHPLPSRPHTLTPPFRTGSLVILVSRFCDTNSSHFIQFSQMLFTEILCYVLCTPPPSKGKAIQWTVSICNIGHHFRAMSLVITVMCEGQNKLVCRGSDRLHI